MKRTILLLALLVTGLCFQATAQKSYDELTFPELPEFDKPDVETFTLKNGVTVYMVENTELPLIDVRIRVRTGGVLVPNDKAGLASVTGTVIRQGGSESISADSLNELLENRAASMETGIGFSSGSARMNVLKEDFEDLLPIFVDLLSNPALPQEKIDLTLKQRKSGISRRNDNQQQVAFREFERLIYDKNSKYGRMTEYASLNNITREDIVDFHKKSFVGPNIMVGITGDFKTRKMKRMVKKVLEEIPSGEKTELTFPEVDYNYNSSVNLVDKPDVNQSMVLMGHMGGLRSNPDYAKLQVMNEVLSGGFSGRLFQKVRTDLGLAYAVFGTYSSNTFYEGLFYTGVMTKSSTTAEAIDAIKGEVKKLQDEPITEKELQDTKDRFLNSIVFRYDSPEKILNERMSYEYRGMDPNTFENYIEELKAVTIEDVQEVAKKYLKPDQMEILVVGNKEEIGDQLNKYGDVNEIDITIPTPGNETQELAAGDAEKGKELLKAMSNALIKPDADFSEIVVVGENTQFNPAMPGGKMSFESQSTINFSEESLNTNIKTPQGEMKIVLEDGKGKRMMMGQEVPLPGPAVEQLTANIKRNYLNVALSYKTYEAEFMGTETVDGATYNKLKVKLGENPVYYYLDPQSNLPAMIEYQTFSAQEGAMVTQKEYYSDWQVKDGVAYAYTEVSYSGGEKTSESTYQDVTFN